MRKKGFTMIEVIVVTIIMAILAAVAIPSMTGFLDKGAQTARDNNARTLFFAAQSALSGELGRNQEILFSEARQVSLEQISHYIDPAEIQNNRTNVYTLSVNSGSGDRLIRLLDPYVNDKALLGHTILIEYNIKTGNVLSCFYSDVAERFSYGDGGYNVVNRDRDALIAGEVGYFGVENTGKVPENEPIGEFAVLLRDYVDPAGTADGVNVTAEGAMNYGLLTLEITLPENLRADINYTIALQSSAGTSETLAVSGGTAEAGAGSAYQFKLDAALASTNLEMAKRSPISYTDAMGQPRTLYAFSETVTGGRKKLVIVLDAVDEGLSIRQNYPSLGCGTLSATVTASDGTESKVVGTAAEGNIVHTYFDGTGEGTANVPYGIKSVRHLNNIRHNAAAAYILQNTVIIKNTGGVPVNWKPLCSYSDAEAGGETGFTGTLKGNGKEITDVKVYGTARAGLFDTIGSGGTVERLMLSYDQVSVGNYTVDGTELGGAIAAENKGTIYACTVTGNIHASSAAGGVAGKNSGAISFCMVGAHVTAVTTAGGVAGLSSGPIAFSEVGTASDKATGSLPDRISGIPYFGMLYPDANFKYKLPGNYDVTNDAFTICAEATTGNGGAVGGIVGRVTGRDGTLTGCVNAALVHGYGGIAGGVLGQVDLPENTAITPDDVIAEHCYNAGLVMGGESAANSGVAGGIAGELSGRIKGCYNTGCVNNYTTTVTIPVVINGQTQQQTFGPVRDDSRSRVQSNAINMIGGLVGHGTINAAVYDCYNAAIAGDEWGGVFGVMESSVDNIENVRFLRNPHNSEDAYYYRTTGGAGNEDRRRNSGNHIQRISSKVLRGLTFGDAFLRGKIAGVGDYSYTLPYYSPDEGEFGPLGQGFHRTDYEKPLEAFADIEIKNIADGRIELTFWTRPGSTDLKLVTNAAQQAFAHTDTLPLSDDVLRALRDASENAPAAVTAGGYTFMGYAVGAESADRYMGYQNEYHIFLRWDDNNDPVLTDYLHAGSATLRAELYQTDEELRYARSETIERTSSIVGMKVITGSSAELAVTHLDDEVDIPQIDKIEIIYPYLASPNVSKIKPTSGNFQSALFNSYDDVLRYVLRFGSNKNLHIESGRNQGSGKYLIYKDENNGVNLILTSDLLPSMYPPNGLVTKSGGLTVEPFYVLVTMQDGSVYSSSLNTGFELPR